MCWIEGRMGWNWRMMKSWVSCYEGSMSNASGLERACACGFESVRDRDRETKQVANAM